MVTKLSHRQRLYVQRYYRRFSEHQIARALGAPRALVDKTLQRLELERDPDETAWVKKCLHDRPPAYRSQIPTPSETRRLSLPDYLVAATVTAIVAGVYLSTLPPTVTGEDSGELIVAAYTLGIPHPPGYPLWTLLAHLFTYVPFGSVGWRVAFSSSILSAATTFILVALTIKVSRSRMGAVGAGFLFAFASEVWEQSVIAEVYALNILLIAVCLVCLLLWYEVRLDRYLYLFALAYGLSLANHSSARVLGPVFLFFVLFIEPKFWRRWKTYAKCLLLAFLGLSVYLYLPIRSAADPPVDWGNPETWQNFWAVVRQEQFAFLLSQNSRSFTLFFQQLWILLQNWALAFTPWLVALPFLGLYPVWKRDKYLFGGTGILALTLSLGVMLALNYGTDAQARWINHVFFIPFYFVAAFLAGAGVAWLARLQIKRVPVAPAGAFLALACGLVPLLSHYERNDKSDYWFAHDFGRNILASLAPDALYIPAADHAMFPAMYLQQIEGLRTDIEIANKYGYIEPHLYREMPEIVRQEFRRIPTPAEQRVIESWVVRHEHRPIYLTTKRSFEQPAGTVVEPYGLTYRVLRPNEEPDADPPWPAYMWHTLDPEDANDEYTAKLILGDYWFAKGQEWLLLGKADKAFHAFDRVAAIQGPDPQTLNNLGTACAEFGQYEAAAGYYAEAVEVDPEYVTALRNLARTQRQLERNEAALDTVGRLIAIEEADYETYWIRGMAQRELGQADKAIETFAKLLDYNPDDADAYREIGLTYLELKHDRHAAEDYLRRSLSLDSAQPELLETLRERNLQVEAPRPKEPQETQAPTPQLPDSPAPQPPGPQHDVPEPEVPAPPRPEPSQP